MVKKKYEAIKKQRRGIAMIELIFALVIMGIVLMSAPMLIQQSIRSGNVALQQEAIAAAASQTSIVLSMSWDENNSNIAAGVSPVLDTNRVPFDFNLTDIPLGLVGVSGRNIEDANTTLVPSAVFGMDWTDNNDTNETDYTKFDDVDDYDGSSFGLIIFNNEVTSADIGDYIDVNITMSTDINYAEDIPISGLISSINIGGGINRNSPAGNPITNIKFVSVNLTSNSGVEELDKNITLEAFSSNIGTSLPEGEEEL